MLPRAVPSRSAQRLVAAPQGSDRPGAPQRRRSRRRSSGDLADDRRRGGDHHRRRQQDRQGADPLAGAAALPLRPRTTRTQVGQGDGRLEGRATCIGQAPGSGSGRARAPAPASSRASTTTRPRSPSTSSRRWSSRISGCRSCSRKRSSAQEMKSTRALHRHAPHGADVEPRQAPHDHARTCAATPCRASPRFGGICERRPALQDLGADGRRREQRRRHRHARRLGLDGRVREVHHAQLLFLDGAFPAHRSTPTSRSSSSPTTPRRRRSTRRRSSTSARSGGTQASRRPTSWRSSIDRASATARALEHLPVPLLGRRQLGRRRQPALPRAGERRFWHVQMPSATARSSRAAVAVAEHADVGVRADRRPALRAGDDRRQRRRSTRRCGRSSRRPSAQDAAASGRPTMLIQDDWRARSEPGGDLGVALRSSGSTRTRSTSSWCRRRSCTSSAPTACRAASRTGRTAAPTSRSRRCTTMG